ncbi:PREDICTED: WD repeat-containing protein on Y chromosome-like isoform X1 [Gavialis gangeticus]|uniref:WD repeat-containing protein on Y chromosome-like isoform X1 n=1 Tax=Gavialis gangeticus TaxID=94835 RepID=UPI00092F93E3|nr:PREDICTED: WD repeat-containing protein on Y chromosome-like isoform X1 [Gavialis gangeticus]
MKNHRTCRKGGKVAETAAMDKQKQKSSWGVYMQEVPPSVTRFDQNLNPCLEEELELGHLLHLKELFADPPPAREGADRKAENKGQWLKPPGKQKEKPPGSLTLQEFQRAFSELIGSESWNKQLQLLFHKVDAACEGLIDWSKFCAYMLLYYKERHSARRAKKEIFQETQPLVRHCVQNKQEPTTRVLAISSPPSLWFVTVSRGGLLTTWDSGLHIRKTFEIATESRGFPTDKRRFKSLVTDAVYMANVHRIAVATTSRDIHFFEASTANLFEDIHLFALNNIPTCLYYWYNAKSLGSRSLLLWGDDQGGVNLLWLLRPRAGMFEKPFRDGSGPRRIFMPDIKEHRKLLRYHAIPDVHEEAISQIQYVSEGDLLITASDSPKASVVIMDVHRKRKVYTWKIKKGVKCFDYCKSLNLLVTGGLDHAVQLWNQYLTDWPVATFQGHSTTVLSTVIHESQGHVFSYSKDSVLKVWDIFSQTCLQTLVLKFPCIQPGRVLEQGDSPFLLMQDPPHLLLVSCADYIGMLKLTHGGAEEEELATHSAPLCSALYSAYSHQVVTGCDDSSVAVWDVETGTKHLFISNAHGNEEITCMALDSSQNRLITAARNGTIKVWNIQNGHNVHQLEVVDEAEVTGLVVLQSRTLLAVGWSRKIVLYHFWEPGALFVTATCSWKGGQLHKEDILAVDYCPALGLLATASFDGEIIVWNSESQRVFLYLRETPRKRSHPPVDKLFFLQHRCTDGILKDSAVLISSEAGALRWWSIFGERQEFGVYYAPTKVDASVLGLAANLINTVLVSGDTEGFIQVWDISGYGLSPSTRGSLKKPPLLSSWRAHSSCVVSIEHLMFDSDAFILSGSADRSARLWTPEGKFVGTFGQEKRWDLKNPSTFTHPKGSWEEKKELRKRTTLTEPRVLLSSKDPVRNMEGDTGEKGNLQESSGQGTTACKVDLRAQLQEPQLPRPDRLGLSPSPSSQLSWEDGVQSRLATPQLLTSTLNQRKCEDPFSRYVEDKLIKRIAGRKARRHIFGTINAKKCNPFGTICSPFQALTTSELQRLTLPEDLPMTPRMLRQGIVCTSEMDLRSLQLTFPELDGEKTDEPTLGEKKKSSVHAKTSFLPPLVKPQTPTLSSSTKAKSFPIPPSRLSP